MTHRSRFVGNTAALAASTAFSTVLTFAQMKIMAANVPLATFGLFASLRGLSLLVSMLSANGLPQMLVRFLPEHAARGERRAAVRLGVVALCVSAAVCAALLAVVMLARGRLFAGAGADALSLELLLWFAVTTLAVTLKLVLYGGFNGLRRFGSQTVFETGTLLAQVVWMAVEADALTLTRLFEITGITSLAAAVLAVPWYAARVRDDVAASDHEPATHYGRYWAGAAGLSMVAVAFTDVDRWVLSAVLAFEALSLFHVASRIARLANRFIAIPVLALQPEVTRVAAEGRHDVVDLSTRAFFKASVLVAVFAAAAICVFAGELIALASSDAFLGARTTLWLLAASIPFAAMTAPLTALMKALDGVKSALYCDLVWATTYVALMLVLAGTMGVMGAGVAQLAAGAVQFTVAMRLARVRPRTSDALSALGRALLCAVLAFAPALLADRLGLPVLVKLALGALGLPVYFHTARRLHVLAGDERARLLQVLRARGAGDALARWVP